MQIQNLPDFPIASYSTSAENVLLEILYPSLPKTHMNPRGATLFAVVLQRWIILTSNFVDWKGNPMCTCFFEEFSLSVCI